MTGSAPGGGDHSPPPGELGPIDPGLQTERTGLAWARTGLALAANAALVGRTGVENHLRVLTVSAIGLALIAAVVGIVGWRRQHAIVRDLVRGEPPHSMHSVALPAGGTVFAALLVLIAVTVA